MPTTSSCRGGRPGGPRPQPRPRVARSDGDRPVVLARSPRVALLGLVRGACPAAGRRSRRRSTRRSTPGPRARRPRRSDRPRASSTSGGRWISSTGTSTWRTCCSPPTSAASRTGRWPLLATIVRQAGDEKARSRSLAPLVTREDRAAVERAAVLLDPRRRDHGAVRSGLVVRPAVPRAGRRGGGGRPRARLVGRAWPRGAVPGRFRTPAARRPRGEEEVEGRPPTGRRRGRRRHRQQRPLEVGEHRAVPGDAVLLRLEAVELPGVDLQRVRLAGLRSAPRRTPACWRGGRCRRRMPWMSRRSALSSPAFWRGELVVVALRGCSRASPCTARCRSSRRASSR